VVQVFEVGEAGGRPFFSMEYVGGGSLAQRLGGAPQPPAEAARLLEPVARAVHAAHQKGVVHRDLQPGNVLLQAAPPAAGPQDTVRTGPPTPGPSADAPERPPSTAYYIPKVTDFGLAKRLEGEAGQTRTGDLLGTPAYMAPEQAEGRSGAVGPPTDVYG